MIKEIPDESRIYRTWSYDPHEDEAYIDPGYDHDLGGYAYRIDGGWRLTDREHNAVDDPYITRKVLDVIRQNPEESAPVKDYNFSKLHYGQPLPMKGK